MLLLNHKCLTFELIQRWLSPDTLDLPQGRRSPLYFRLNRLRNVGYIKKQALPGSGHRPEPRARDAAGSLPGDDEIGPGSEARRQISIVSEKAIAFSDIVSFIIIFAKRIFQ